MPARPRRAGPHAERHHHPVRPAPHPDGGSGGALRLFAGLVSPARRHAGGGHDGRRHHRLGRSLRPAGTDRRRGRLACAAGHRPGCDGAGSDLAIALQPPARPRPARHRGGSDQRHRHRAVGHRRSGAGPARAQAARRPAADGGGGLCHRLLPPRTRRSHRLPDRGSRTAPGRGLPHPQAQDRLGAAGGYRADACLPRRHRPRLRPAGGLQPRL